MVVALVDQTVVLSVHQMVHKRAVHLVVPWELQSELRKVVHSVLRTDCSLGLQTAVQWVHSKVALWEHSKVAKKVGRTVVQSEK